MFVDDKLEFCDATALNQGGAASYNIGDVVDTAVARDLGNGQPVYLVIVATTAITTAGAAGSVTFALVSDGTDTIATNGTQTTHFQSRAWATSGTPIAAGTVLFKCPIPSEGPAYEQYLAVQQITSTTALNGGAVDAFLTVDAARWKAYDDAAS